MGNDIDLLSNPNVEIETVSPSTYRGIKLIGANEVQQMKLKPINWIIPNFLPEGLTILAGRPKIGKSWLALNLSLAIARGGKALSYFNCNKHSIFYIPYEDNIRRLRDRMNNILSFEADRVAPSNLHYPQDLEFPKLNDGGLNQIKKIITDNKYIKVIIVDTFGSAISQKKSIAHNSFLDDYNLASDIQKLAIGNQICIILLHHTRKATSENIYDEISGTTGLTAAPDTLIVLKKESKSFTMHVTGRDVPDNEYTLKFNQESFNFSVEGLKEEIQMSEQRKEILDLFKQDLNKILKTNEITSTIGKKETAVSRLLSKMVSDGILTKPAYGSYKLNDN
jgi:RecA-family ATPase